MKKYVLPYGQGSKEIELDETLVLKEVRTKEFEPLKNIPYEVLEAIYHPIGCPPINEIIKPGRKLLSSATIRPASQTALISCRSSSMR